MLIILLPFVATLLVSLILLGVTALVFSFGSARATAGWIRITIFVLALARGAAQQVAQVVAAPYLLFLKVYTQLTITLVKWHEDLAPEEEVEVDEDILKLVPVDTAQ